jgi:hypothetical protein
MTQPQKRAPSHPGCRTQPSGNSPHPASGESGTGPREGTVQVKTSPCFQFHCSLVSHPRSSSSCLYITCHSAFAEHQSTSSQVATHSAPSRCLSPILKRDVGEQLRQAHRLAWVTTGLISSSEDDLPLALQLSSADADTDKLKLRYTRRLGMRGGRAVPGEWG